ncbi:hypothetical protein SDC9_42639 [bioreactor metagenome]|uniref:Uncharacterized protein n=1 Tax=bioreactor metagenome TaxID=1076179 RepID=A0A644VYL7_9ZZZZ
MCLEISRIDHDRLVFGALSGKAHHDPGEDPVFVASLEPVAFSHSPPALPAVVEGLRRTVFLRRVTPAQPIAIDENYAAEDTAIIDAGLAMALGEERLQPLHLRVGQPVKIAHRSGLLAEPETRQRTEINGSGAYAAA